MRRTNSATAFLVLTALAIIVATPEYLVVAQTTTPSASMSATTSTQIEATNPVSATNNSPLDTRTQERLINLAANVSNMMEASIKRLSDIANRLESRTSKETLEETDRNKINENLQIVRQRLSEAEQKLRALDVQVRDTFTSSNPRIGWPEIRAGFLGTKQLMRDAKEANRAILFHLGVEQPGLFLINATQATTTATDTATNVN